jgi:YggT family protein
MNVWDDVAGIIVKAAYWLLVPAALLRFYMQWVRVPFRNPVGQFICAMTDWIVLPMRRVIKGSMGFDWASLIAAILLELALALLFDALTGRLGPYASNSGAGKWLMLGLFGLAITALTMMLWLTIACAIASWFRLDSTALDALAAISAPWLKPIRRRLPLVGGFDLSPLVLLVLLQIGLVLLSRLQFHALLLLR